jgi:hypothetical protein
MTDMISVKVGDLDVLGDGKRYQDHVWNVHVHVDEDSYDIQRTYLEFAYLDSALRKRFVSSTLPELPLAAVEKISQTLNKEVKKDQATAVAGSPSTRVSDDYAGSASPGKMFGRASVFHAAGANKSLFVDPDEDLKVCYVSIVEPKITSLSFL